MCFIVTVQPDSYFLHIVNAKRILTAHGCLRSKCFAGVEPGSTVTNYLLRICDVKICISFPFAGSMNQA